MGLFSRFKEYGNVESSHGILRVERVFARVTQQVQIPGTKRMTKRVTKRMGQAGAKQVVKKVMNCIFFISSVVGTHSHTAMLDRLGVASCGVGGFEAEPTMRPSFPFSVARKYSTERVLGLFDLTSRLKYSAKHVEADAAYNSKKMELKTNINRVILNRLLAKAFRCRGQDSRTEIMQQLHRLLVSPSVRIFHGQSLGIQQPLQPPLSRPPLQIVHQPAALFSTTPSRLQPLPALLH
ncbi:putative aconitate hydratase [Helianthus annuus]|nr:putative aconitate hydratase [Helianthus annuus]